MLLWFVGHFVWSMYGKMLTHVWFTQTRFTPHGVPSWTRPFSVYSLDWGGPLVVLFECDAMRWRTKLKLKRKLVQNWIEILHKNTQRKLHFVECRMNMLVLNAEHHLLALIFNTFDRYNCTRIELIHSAHCWLTFAVLALQWATYHVSVAQIGFWIIIFLLHVFRYFAFAFGICTFRTCSIFNGTKLRWILTRVHIFDSCCFHPVHNDR